MSHQETVKTTLNGQTKLNPRDTEVVPKAKRREFSVAYKNRILTEVDGCAEVGQIGSILRREGLYSSHLSKWRQQRAVGQLQGLRRKQRGRKPDPQAAELARLQRENERLKARLEQAEAIIEVQKKLCRLLELPTAERDEQE